MSFFSNFQRLFVLLFIIFLLFGCGGGGGGDSSSNLCISESTTETSTHISKSYIANESCEVFYDKLVERLGRPNTSGPNKSDINGGTLYTMLSLFSNGSRYLMQWGSATCAGYSRCMVDERITK